MDAVIKIGVLVIFLYFTLKYITDMVKGNFVFSKAKGKKIKKSSKAIVREKTISEIRNKANNNKPLSKRELELNRKYEESLYEEKREREIAKSTVIRKKYNNFYYITDLRMRDSSEKNKKISKYYNGSNNNIADCPLSISKKK